MKPAAALLALTSMMLSPLHTAAQTPPVYVVIFTHIEDNVPGSELGTADSRRQYVAWREQLIAAAELFRSHRAPWVLEPDWKILEAALRYEDATLTAATSGKNLFRYLKEDLQVVVDPHSHEKQGYNYTDVAHLLDSLGVGGSTVIGGHVWDPTLPQFQRWDRFRLPVRGSKYPWALWRGTILMGSGTPNHVNDPVVSGVWRPKDRFHFFEDEPAGNIVCIGQYTGDTAGVNRLVALYESGEVSSQYMLTAHLHLKPAVIAAAGGLRAVEDTLLTPLLRLRDQGKIVLTDFTSLVEDWRSRFHSRAFIYGLSDEVSRRMEPQKEAPLLQAFPNPFNTSTTIRFLLRRREPVSLELYDVNGRRVKTLLSGEAETGEHVLHLSAENLYAGLYVCRLSSAGVSQKIALVLLK